MRRNRRQVALELGVLAAFLTLVAPTPAHTSAAEIAARRLVEHFGRRLQGVYLSSPPPQIRQMIRQHYGALVSPSLLARWLQNPRRAPGRWTSSPWPDHIEVTSLTRAGHQGFVIQGHVVEMTSTGTSARIPVCFVVQKLQNRWQITEYTPQPCPATECST